MAIYSRSVNFLPDYYKTSTNQKFLAATLDQLLQPAQTQKLSGYVGRRTTDLFDAAKDVYVPESTDNRQRYQLENATVFNDTNGKRVSTVTYEDLLDYIKHYGGPVTNHNVLFQDSYLSFDAKIDVDKLVNFHEYYWLPGGPLTIGIDYIDVTTDIIGQSSYTYTLADSTEVSLSSGMLIKFGENVSPQNYVNKTYYVENVGDGIILVDFDELEVPETYVRTTGLTYEESEFDTLALEQTFNTPLDRDYIVMQRGSVDKNPWSRTNRWVHRTVVEAAQIANGQVPSLNYAYQAKRPIIEFRRNYKLFNFGTRGLAPVNILDTTYTDAFSNLNGQLYGTTVDGVTLEHGYRMIFAADTDVAVVNRIYEVEIVTIDKGNGQAFSYVGDASTDTFEFISWPVEDTQVLIGGQIQQIELDWNIIEISGVKYVQFAQAPANAAAISLIALNNERKIYLKPAADADVQANDVVLVKNGINNQGTNWTYNGTEWIASQNKIELNQSPYFDIFDQQGHSYGDLTYYPASNFPGSSLFSYKQAPLPAEKFSVNSITVTNGGSGYTTPPSVVFSGGGGSGAIATAVVQEGVVTQIIVNSEGLGYISAPTVSLVSPAGTNITSASAVANMILTKSVQGADSELGFKLSYRNFNSIGDIVFDINMQTDTFAYTVESLPVTGYINEGYVALIAADQSLTYENNYMRAAEDNVTYAEQMFVVNQTQVNDFSVTVEPDQVDVYPSVMVFVNWDKVSNWQIVTEGAKRLLRFDSDLAVDDLVFVKIKTRDRDTANWTFEPNKLWTNNPFNDTLNTVTLGQMTQYSQKLSYGLADLQGVSPGVNNLRDLPQAHLAGRDFIANESNLHLASAMFQYAPVNLFLALDWAADEYARFKSQFVNELVNYPDTNLTTDQIVDQVLKVISERYVGRNYHIHSDMAPWGDNFSTKIYEVLDPNDVIYYLDQVYVDTVNNERAVSVYINDELQLKNIHYTFDSDSPTFRFTDRVTLATGDQIRVKEYVSTAGGCIPCTPSKLGLYPRYQPEIFTDNTYVTEQTFIRGHDGSLVPIYDDYRDAAILELERRIYNSIKVQWSREKVDHVSLQAGALRDNDYTRQEFNSTLNADFARWAVLNGIDYTSNDVFQSNNPLTYNYAVVKSKISGEKLPGYYREIYRYYYDTSTPSLTPWEMLGIHEKPTWWDDEYGPAPWTSQNTKLWEDLEAGRIRQDPNTTEVTFGALVPRPAYPLIDTKYARPGLSTFIPVDDHGNLLDPVDAGIAGAVPASKLDRDWLAGDQGPAEYAWRRSSQYPFALQKVMALLKPGRYFGLLYDNSQLSLGINGHWQRTDTKKLSRPQDIYVPYETRDGALVYGAGYLNFLAEYMQANNIDVSVNLGQRIRNMTTNLVYRVGGYTKTTSLKFLISAYSPSSVNQTAFIPQDNVDLVIHKSAPKDRFDYSAVIIEKTTTGYKVSGYDFENPFFTVYPSLANNNKISVSYNSTDEVFAVWQPGINVRKDDILKFSGKYYRATEDFVTGNDFDTTVVYALPDLPRTAGLTVTHYNDYKITPVRVLYNTEFNTIQETYDFLISYGRFITVNGFQFLDTVGGSGQPVSWESLAKQYLEWTQQGWGTDVALIVSPAAKNFRIIGVPGTLENIYNSNLGFRQIVDQNNQAISTTDLNVTRLGTTVEVTASPATNGIYKFKGTTFDYEHAIIFDNVTQFNDLVYDPAFGYRQERFRLLGYRTANWQGRLEAPGYLIDQAIINDWASFNEYNLGDIVNYKGTNYAAKFSHVSAAEFDYAIWSQLEQSIEPGIVPNASTKAQLFTQIYDNTDQPFVEKEQAMARHMVGYQKRQYLENLLIDDTTQFQFYQGFIKEKGTSGALTKLGRANIDQNAGDLKVYNEWLVRSGEFGSSETTSFFDFRALDTDFKFQNVAVELVDTFDRTKQNNILQLTPTDDRLLKYDSYYTNNYFRTKFERDGPKRTFTFNTAGYARLDDVDQTVLTVDELKNISLENLVNGYTVWVGYTADQSWDILRLTDTASLIFQIEQDASSTQYVISTNTAHELSVGNEIVVKNFKHDDSRNENLVIDGYYTVSDIVSPTSFKAVAVNPVAITEAYVKGSGVILKWVSSRFQHVNDAIGYAPPRGWNAGDKVWIDNTNTNRWQVFERREPWELSYSIQAVPVDDYDTFGTTSIVASGSGNKLIITGAAYDGNGKLFVNDDLEGYQQRQVISPSITAGSGHLFGWSLSATTLGDIIAIGAPGTGDPGAVTTKPGAVYIGQRNEYDQFDLIQAIQAPSAFLASNAQFGYAVELSDDGEFLFIGSPGTNRVFVYELDTSSQYRYVTSYSPGINAKFGHALRYDADNEILYVGAPDYSVDQAYSGAVYRMGFNLSNFLSSTLSVLELIRSISVDVGEQFGYSLDIRVDSVSTKLVVGALGSNTATFYYPNVSGTSEGVGASFDISTSFGEYIVAVNQPGIGYHTGDQIEVYGSTLQGSSPNNDLIITVDSVDGTGGIQTITATGLASDYSAVSVVDLEGINVVRGSEGATFDVTKISSVYLVTLGDHSGFDYEVGDKIYISGALLGGIQGTTPGTGNDITITITQIGPGGSVVAFTHSGTASDLNNVISAGAGYVFDVPNDSSASSIESTLIVPHGIANDQYGYRIKLSPDGNSAALSSVSATVKLPMVIDTSATTFDFGQTKIVDIVNNTGAVHTFSKINDQWSWDQLIRMPHFSTRSQSGSSIYYENDTKLLLGAPYADIENTDAGAVYIFERDNADTRAWTLLRSETPVVDKAYLNKASVFSQEDNTVRLFLEYYDPVKGLFDDDYLLDVDVIANVDPAVYAEVTDEGLIQDSGRTWYNNRVGTIWLDTGSFKYIWYEQGDIEYRLNHWGQLFPGTSVDVYEWIESTDLPVAWLLNNAESGGSLLYTDNTFNSRTINGITYYYFWVRNNAVINPQSNKSRSAAEIASGIRSVPSTQKISAIAPNALGMFNYVKYFAGNNNVVQISKTIKTQKIPYHIEWQVLREGYAGDLPNNFIKTKIIDSLSGVDSAGNAVPNSRLPAYMQIGTGIRPRQTLFVDKTEAIKVAQEFINEKFSYFRISPDTYDFTKLLDDEPQPKQNVYTINLFDEDITSWDNRTTRFFDTIGNYDEAVADLNELSDIEPQNITDGYVVLVQSDSSISNQWSLYSWNLSTQQWERLRNQSYQTTRYWEYIDWYNPNFDQSKLPRFFVTSDVERENLSGVVDGDVIRQDAASGWTLYERQSGFDVLVGEQNGTIQLKLLVNARGNLVQRGYDYESFDAQTFDLAPVQEMRNIIEAVVEDLFVGDLEIYANEFYFVLFRHILSSQGSVDWLVKSSFITIDNYGLDFKNSKTYNPSRTESTLNYVEEVKPFHTKVREYLDTYTPTLTYNHAVSDFDNPPVRSSQTEVSVFDINLQQDHFTAYPYKFYGDNYKLGLASVTVITGGNNYTDPVITVTGGQQGGRPPRLVAKVVAGAITEITVLDKGYGFVTTPTVVITDVTGSGAKAYANLDNDVRNPQVTVKFDRIKETNDVLETTTVADEDWRDFTYHAADRIYKLYQPKAGMPGRDFGQLMTGVDFPGVTVRGLKFSQGPGWEGNQLQGFDAEPWDNWDLDTAGIPTPTDDYTLDQVLTGSAFGSAVGVGAQDLTTDGSKFLSAYYSHAPEEKVQGQIFDTLDIKVYGSPTDGSSQSHVDAYVGDAVTRQYSFTNDPLTLAGIQVYVDEQIMSLGTEYTVDLASKQILFSPLHVPPDGSVVVIYSQNISGSGIQNINEYLGDGTQRTFTVSHASSGASIVAFVNGQQTTAFTETRSGGTVLVTFAVAPSLGHKVTVLSVTALNPRQYSKPYRQEITVTSAAITEYNLEQVPEYAGPPVAGIFVYKNKILLQPPDVTYHVTSAFTYDYDIDSNPGVNSALLAYSNTSVYINGAKLIPGAEWILDVTTNPSVPKIVLTTQIQSDGDLLSIVADVQSAYHLIDDGQKIVFDTALAVDDVIEIFTFSNHDGQSIRTEVFRGSANLNIEQGFDGQAFDVASFDAETVALILRGYLPLSRAITNTAYVRVSKNGDFLSPNFDWRISPTDATQIEINDRNISVNDRFVVTYFSEEYSKPQYAYRVFKDMLGRVNYYRISKDQSTQLARQLLPGDSDILVVDASKLPDPNPAARIPGVVMIGKERITYYAKNGNLLSNIKRGTLGTGVKSAHAVGSYVVDISLEQKIPYSDLANFEKITANGTSTVFTTEDLTAASSASVLVYVGGRRVLSGYTVTALNPVSVTFSTAPAADQNVAMVVKNGQIWYDQGVSTASNGQGLQDATTEQAQFILARPPIYDL